MKLGELDIQPFEHDTQLSHHNDMMRLPEYYRNEKGYSGKWVYMTPQEYITRCKEGFASKLKGRSGYEDYKTTPYLRRSTILAKKYARDMLRGDKFPAPYITYEDDGSFRGQEGLHRAMAAKMLKLTDIPVFVETMHKD